MLEQLRTDRLVVPEFTDELILGSSLPQEVNHFFEARSKMYVLPENSKGLDGFDCIYKIACSQDSAIRYVGSERKIYDTDGTDETLMHIIELASDSTILGHGEIRLGHREEPFFKDKPFVGFTRTNSEFLRQGYGLRRLFLMNYLARKFFELPLNSSTLISEESERLWQRLCTDNYAESYKDNDRIRYVFVMP